MLPQIKQASRLYTINNKPRKTFEKLNPADGIEPSRNREIPAETSGKVSHYRETFPGSRANFPDAGKPSPGLGETFPVSGKSRGHFRGIFPLPGKSRGNFRLNFPASGNGRKAYTCSPNLQGFKNLEGLWYIFLYFWRSQNVIS